MSPHAFRPGTAGDGRMSAVLQLAAGALMCRDFDGVDILLGSWPMGLEGSLVAAARRAWTEGVRPLTAPALVARMGTNAGPWTRETLEDAQRAFAASEYAESGLSALANDLEKVADGVALARELAAATNTLDVGGDPADVRRALLPLVEVGESPSEQAWADTGRQCDAALARLERPDGGGLSLGLLANRSFDLVERMKRAQKAGKESVVKQLQLTSKKAGILVADVAGHSLTDAALAARLHDAFLA